MKKRQPGVDKERCYGTAVCMRCALRTACEDHYRDVHGDPKDRPMLEYNDSVENTASDYNTQYDVFEGVCGGDEPEKPALVLGGVAIPDEAAPVVIEAVRRLAVVYKEQPVSFGALMETVYGGLTQTDMARLRGITRQSVSKALRRENARPLWEDLSRFMDTVDADTLALWRLLCVERLSYREAAKKMRISHGRVAQLVKGLKERGLDLRGDVVMLGGKLVMRPANIPRRLSPPAKAGKKAKAASKPNPRRKSGKG